jgi:hypothetical protein
VWREVETQITDHLRAHHISAGMAAFPCVDPFFATTISLLQPTKGRQALPRLFVHSDHTASDFTTAELLKVSKAMRNPVSGSPQRILLFGMSLQFVTSWSDPVAHAAPRHRDLWAPIGGAEVPHPCFPWRVWSELQHVLSTLNNREGACVAACPGLGQV